jgi:hypothetical protein
VVSTANHGNVSSNFQRNYQGHDLSRRSNCQKKLERLEQHISMFLTLGHCKQFLMGCFGASKMVSATALLSSIHFGREGGREFRGKLLFCVNWSVIQVSAAHRES